jgi:hypothetical protein
VLSKLDDGIPGTGIDILDGPAIKSRSFAQKMDAIRRMGYDVVEDAKFMSRGEFDIDARTFTYNPETMTRLDLAHEWWHYKQLIRLEKQGLRFRSKGSAAMEVGAYRFEQRLWERIGSTPGDDYLRFHSGNLTEYLDEMRANRRWLFYHQQHAEIFK